MVTGAVIATAFRVAVIHVRIQPFPRGVFKLLVSHGAKRHTTNNGSAVFARLLIAQNGVVFFAANLGPLKPHEGVVFRMLNDHLFR